MVKTISISKNSKAKSKVFMENKKAFRKNLKAFTIWEH